MQQLFAKKGETEVQITQAKGHATELAQKYGDDVDMIVCCGGDGTLSEVITGLMPFENKPELGYIPTGTTNDFAKSINISKNPELAANMILDGVSRNYDVGLFNNKYFIYVASFGIFSRSSYAATQQMKNTLGRLAYVLEGAKEVFALKSYHLKITTDNEVLEDDYLFGAISNSTSIGGVIKLKDPDILFDDGLFEVVLIKYPKNIIEFGQILHALQTGKYDESPFITFVHTQKVVVESEEEMPWSLDGEFDPGSSRVEITNVHRAIKVVH